MDETRDLLTFSVISYLFILSFRLSLFAYLTVYCCQSVNYCSSDVLCPFPHDMVILLSPHWTDQYRFMIRNYQTKYKFQFWGSFENDEFKNFSYWFVIYFDTFFYKNWSFFDVTYVVTDRDMKNAIRNWFCFGEVLFGCRSFQSAIFPKLLSPSVICPFNSLYLWLQRASEPLFQTFFVNPYFIRFRKMAMLHEITDENELKKYLEKFRTEPKYRPFFHSLKFRLDKLFPKQPFQLFVQNEYMTNYFYGLTTCKYETRDT